jgi:hypothetical protein
LLPPETASGVFLLHCIRNKTETASKNMDRKLYRGRKNFIESKKSNFWIRKFNYFVSNSQIVADIAFLHFFYSSLRYSNRAEISFYLRGKQALAGNRETKKYFVFW